MKPQENLRYSAYLGPRYWIVWLAIGLGKAIAFLPLSAQYGIGKVLGLLSYYLLKRRRADTLTNISVCFPEYTTDQQKQLVKDTFISNGIGLIEALRSWYRDPKTLADRIDYHGKEHLEAALARGKGVILLGGHFSTLDLIGSLTTIYFRADVLQRAHSNPLFNAFMTRSRAGLYGKVIDKHDIRSMIRSLKHNHIVWYATDQDYGRNNTVFVPFFHQHCSTLTMTMRLAKLSGAAVLPFSHRRINKRYEITVHEALDHFPSGDIEADATRLNKILENAIRVAPEQYLWMHRRFKTTPEIGGENIYGQVRDGRFEKNDESN